MWERASDTLKKAKVGIKKQIFYKDNCKAKLSDHKKNLGEKHPQIRPRLNMHIYWR